MNDREDSQLRGLFIAVFPKSSVLQKGSAHMASRGKVKWFNESKGFGFIQKEEGGDVFVHYGDIESPGFKTLSEGEEVTFEVIDSPKGPKATHVVKVTTT
jgi:cold shock protein